MLSSRGILKTALVLVALVALSWPVPVHAQTVCGERGKIVGYLSSRYFEQPVSMGLSKNGSVLEVFASEKGTWTILVTRPDGVTCMIASGKAWEKLPVAVSGRVS